MQDDPVRKFMSTHGFFELLDDTGFELRAKIEDLESFFELQWLDYAQRGWPISQIGEQIETKYDELIVKLNHMAQLHLICMTIMEKMEAEGHPDFEMYMLQIDIANTTDEYDNL